MTLLRAPWSLSGTLAIALIVGALSLAGGAWLGAAIQAGRDALAREQLLHSRIAQVEVAAETLRQRTLRATQDFRAANAQLADTAQGLTRDLASIQATTAAQRREVSRLLAAHPEWSDCRIGTDGVYAWNAAAAGANPAATPSAADAGTAARAVSGNAAGAGGRRPAGAVEQLPGSGAAVPPLPLQDGAPDPGAGDP